MTLEQVLDAIWQLSITAGMNQRYHQHLADQAASWDFLIKIAVAIITAIGAVVSVMSWQKPSAKPLGNASAALSVAGMLAAIVLNIAPSDATSKQHLDLFRRWSELRLDADALSVQFSDTQKESEPSPPFLITRYSELLAKKNNLNSLEPAPIRELLERFQIEEEAWRKQYDPKEEEAVAIADRFNPLASK